MVATLSDTENDTSDEYVDECSHVMGFATSIDKMIVESASDSEDSSDDEVPKKMTFQIERMSSAKFDEVLSAQKPNSDKTGLGDAVSSSPSYSTTFRSRTVFVPQSEISDKGMKSKTVLAKSKSFVRPHVCHHCGVSGYIHPNCFKLYPHK